MAHTLEEKRKFFEELDRLDTFSDDEDDNQPDHISISSTSPDKPSPVARTTSRSARTKQPHHIPLPAQPKAQGALKSAVSPVLPSEDIAQTKSKPSTPRANKQLQKPKTKGRKKNDIQIFPADQQAFRGQTFYFIPNDNIAAHRKRRIACAIAHGAIWAREFSSAVTYVVADSYVDYEKVVKHCGGPQRVGSTTIVNDRWLTECFGFKEMRATYPERFQLPGKPRALEPFKDCDLLESSEKFELEHQLDASQTTSSCGSNMDEPKPAARSTTGDRLKRVPPQRPLSDSDVNEASTDDHKHELFQIIAQVTKLDGVSVDMDDESDRPSSSDSSGLDRDDQVAARRPEVPPENAGFRCMERNSRSSSMQNPNAATIEILQQMASLYDASGDQWRTRAYRQAIGQLNKQQGYIRTAKEARAIPLIGSRIAAKIEEIVQTSRLRRLDSALSDPGEQLLCKFMGIYQVGYPSASRWIAQGYRSLEELRSHPDLTPNQRIGIEQYDDFLQRIPRSEVEQLAAIVQQAARQADRGLQLIIGGSYRRGNADSGDVDILITKPQATLEHIRTLVMDTIVPGLLRKGFLKVALATGRSRHPSSKWHGACALPDSSVWRRIDLLFVPWSELGAALIYFTGNDIFNRSVRLLASRKGMRLNQHGLYKDVMRGPDRANIATGTLVESHDERKIFECLGVPWWEPHERQC